jgi:hypothetical protein
LRKQPPASPLYACDPLPGPYFERDGLLDPPQLPPPGWFAGVEFELVKAHVKNRLMGMVQIGTNAPDTVQLESASLDWTVAPRFEVGYRLPSGFGEFALAYRFFSSQGTSVFPAVDAPADVQSRLAVSMVDLDYVSREYSLWSRWDMKWRAGLRIVSIYFDSRADEPFDLAAAGSGVFEQRTSNSFVGFGPHVGLELARRFEQSGLALVGRIDGGGQLGRIRHGFFEVSTTAGPDGQLLTGETRLSGSQDVPVLSWQLGLSWQPPGPRYQDVHFFLGYHYEYWWNVGRLSSTTSRGEMSDQGIFMWAEFNF